MIHPLQGLNSSFARELAPLSLRFPAQGSGSGGKDASSLEQCASSGSTSRGPECPAVPRPLAKVTILPVGGLRGRGGSQSHQIWTPPASPGSCLLLAGNGT